MIAAFRWFLPQMDARSAPRDADDADAVPGLRRLHREGMLCNAIQLIAIVGSISYIVVTLT